MLDPNKVEPQQGEPEWLAPIPENIPDELKQYTQWVVWKAVYLTEKDKWTKVPYDPKTNKKAKNNDPSTWGSFDKAWKAFQAGGWGYTGIGFELSANDPFCGWDLDHCRDPETGDNHPTVGGSQKIKIVY